MKTPVTIIMGSGSDREFVRSNIEPRLKEFNLGYDIRIASAHKTPRYLDDMILEYDSDDRARIYCAVASKQNALGNACAANTVNPVISINPDSSMLHVSSAMFGASSGIAAYHSFNTGNIGLLAAKLAAYNEPEQRAFVMKKQREMIGEKIRPSTPLEKLMLEPEIIDLNIGTQPANIDKRDAIAFLWYDMEIIPYTDRRRELAENLNAMFGRFNIRYEENTVHTDDRDSIRTLLRERERLLPHTSVVYVAAISKDSQTLAWRLAANAPEPVIAYAFNAETAYPFDTLNKRPGVVLVPAANPEKAALLAAKALGMASPAVREKLKEHHSKMKSDTEQADREIRETAGNPHV